MTTDWMRRMAASPQALTVDDIDVFAIRASGFMDRELISLIEEQVRADLLILTGEDGHQAPVNAFVADWEGEPTDAQKRYCLNKYEEFAKTANERAQNGRTDWTAADIWAIDRARFAKAFYGTSPPFVPVPWPSQERSHSAASGTGYVTSDQTELTPPRGQTITIRSRGAPAPSTPAGQMSDAAPAYAIGTVVRRKRKRPDPDQTTERFTNELSSVLREIGADASKETVSGDTIIRWRGSDVVRVNPQRRPSAWWIDESLGTFLSRLMEYNGLVRGLQENRGIGTASLRQMLRENLSVDLLVSSARAAGASIEKSGGLMTKTYSLSHPLLGDFAQLTVPRGQNHVIDIAFESSEAFKPLSFLVAFVYRQSESSK